MARNRNTCRLHCWGLAFEPRLQRWGRRQYDLSGVVQDPTLGTNAPVQGKLFSSLYVTAAANGIEAVVESKGTPWW